MTEVRSYYGRTVLKEPVWKREIPWYFFAGGSAGAAATLALAARIAGNEELRIAASRVDAAGCSSAHCFSWPTSAGRSGS